MSDCCQPMPTGNKPTFSVTEGDGSRCPRCGRKGKPVDLITVKAMLARSLLEVGGRSYRFCPWPDCPVVYFASDSPQVFSEEDLRVRVFQKHPHDPDVLVCYCFRYTVAAIQEEVRRAGQSTAAEVIRAGVQAGLCACEIRNPQGRCCLGNVRAVVKQARAQAAAETLS